MTQVESGAGLEKREFYRLLKGVSRSIYLSLRVLPPTLGLPLGTAYLLARAADTCADTRLLPPPTRRAWLDRLGRCLREGSAWTEGEVPAAGATPAERELAARLPRVIACFRRLPPGPRELVAHFLDQVTGAMRWDLDHFPPEDSGRLAALEGEEELEEYCRLAGGTAGSLWTRLLAREGLPGWERMEEQGVAYGKGLQLINILRDLPRDLRIGRCYLPRTALEPLGLAPGELLRPGTAPRLLPLHRRLVHRARELLGQGRAYLLALPRNAPRLRLATALPLAIGLETLAALEREKEILDPLRRVKIGRPAVRRLVAGLLLRCWSHRALARYLDRLGGRG